ncbi:SAM-dependent methyltransferase [Streptomyces daliensis]|uniref:Class I SAM-dependent methyltransferase n=1 Tax=Streptomyces daliensis TaxID=299421 RepID=A0A8T4IXL8_9ACTN|nr:class I SAM-dependent methyltransferase [Streptomyces daliensis]
MDTHDIAEAYTVVPVAAPPLADEEYAAVLRADFTDHYAHGRDIWTGEEAMRETPRILLAALADVRDAHILDIGTGHGRDAAILLAGGHRVTGIDLVASDEWAGLRARWPGRARFGAAELTEPGELTGARQYDAVLDNGCLHHQHPDRYPAYLRRVHELLHPGGLLTVSVFHSAAERGDLFVNGGRRLYREFTEAELAGLLTAHGFSVVELRTVPRGRDALHYLVGTFRSTPAATTDADADELT